MAKRFEAQPCPECGANAWAVFVCEQVQVAHCTACNQAMMGEPQAIRPADETECAGIDDAYELLADKLPTE